MDILVTENRSSTRTYRVNDVSSTAEAIEKVQGLKGAPPDTNATISVEENGQTDNVQHSTQIAPKRQP